MGIACAEATAVPICSASHSRDDDGWAASFNARCVAATTSGSGLQAPRSGSERTKATAFHSRSVTSAAPASIPSDTAAATSAAD